MKNKLWKMTIVAVLILPVLIMPVGAEAAVKDPFKELVWPTRL